MFTKQDYIEYFSLIELKEEAMVSFISKALEKIEDEPVWTVLKQILNDEVSHVDFTKALLSTVEWTSQGLIYTRG